MISLYTYHLPFHKPFQAAGHTWREREGILLHYQDHRLEALSEIAPLPGVSDESVSGLIKELTSGLPDIQSLLASVEEPVELQNTLRRLRLPPSVQFGVSAAAISLAARRKDVPVHDWLGVGYRKQISINATVGLEGRDRVLDEILKLCNLGYTTIKLKSSREPGNLPEIIRTVSDQFPGVAFRVDANRSWPLHVTSGYLNLFSGLPVEYCEEPAAWNSTEELLALKRASPIPIALDESIQRPSRFSQAVRTGLTENAVIKPMLFGDILGLAETIRDNQDIMKTVDLVLSGTLESAVGRNILNTLTGMLGSVVRAHGTGTGKLFQKDLFEVPDGPVIELPAAPDWEIPLKKCNRNLLKAIVTDVN